MRKFLLLIVSSVLLVSNAHVAQAHSTLVSSIPASGAILKVVPKVVTLTFNEKLLLIAGEQPNSLTVISPSGKSLAMGVLTVRGSKISTAVKSNRLSGKFKVAYRVVSSDGHPISGEYFFTVL